MYHGIIPSAPNLQPGQIIQVLPTFLQPSADQHSLSGHHLSPLFLHASQAQYLT